MTIRMCGAALTLLSGVLYAVKVTKEHRRKEACFEELQLILEHFVWQLQTNLSALSVCCQAAAGCGKGQMGTLFRQLALRLEQGSGADPGNCMEELVMAQNLPAQLRQRLFQLADTLGRYDLSGQIAGIQAVQALCRRDLQTLESERTKTVKSCRVLGLCTGAAVAILLL